MQNITIKKLFYLLMSIVIIIAISYISISYYFTKDYVLESLEQESVNRAYRVAKKLSEIHDETAHKYQNNENVLRHSLELSKEYFKKSGRKANLDALKKNLEHTYNHLTYNVYVINSDYIIENTTYPPDMGLDFKLLPLALNVVDEVYKTPGMVHVSHLTNDTTASDYKMYILQRAPNKNYMIQLAITLNSKDMEKEFIANMTELVPSLLKTSIYIYLPNQIGNKMSIDKLWIIDYKNKKKQDRVNDRDYYEEFFSLFDPENKIEKNDFGNIMHKFISDNEFKSRHDHSDNKFIQKIIMPFQSYLNMEENTGYILYLEFDESKAHQIIDDINHGLYLIWLLLFILSATFIYILNRYIIQPISIVESRMQKKQLINEFDFSNTSNEINSMALSYNQLLKDLKREIISNEDLLEEFKTFTANTVHQVRTPVSVMKIALEMIETDNKDALLQIESSLRSMEHMYDSLSYALNQDTIIFEIEEINLSKLLEERIRFFNLIALANDTSIEHEIQENIIVSLNKIEAEFLIDNNISNALKFSTPRQTIQVRLLQASPDILLLFDSKGKEIENKVTIFDRYKRGDKTKQGSGIGLNIVDSICKKNNILIDVTYIDGYNRFMYLFETK